MIIPKSVSCLILRSSVQQFTTTTYSASIVERENKFCVLVPEELRDDPRK